jgi:hypothetical protein
VYNLKTRIILSKVVAGKRKLKTKAELADELHEHLEIRKSDGRIIHKNQNFGQVVKTEDADDYPSEVDSEESEEESEESEDSGSEDEELARIAPQPRRPASRVSPEPERDEFRPIAPERSQFNPENLKPAKFEPVVPPKVVKELKANFTFITDLQKKGKGKKIPAFNSTSLLKSIILAVYLEKYDVAPILPIDMNPETTWSEEHFFHELSIAIKRGYKVLPIPMFSNRHSNLIIIKVDTREIIRFEPHGGKFLPEPDEDEEYGDADIEINRKMKRLTDRINDFLGLNERGKRPFVYHEPIEIVPRDADDRPRTRGFQGMEEMISMDFGGLCQLWTMFFMECVLKNPDMPIKDIYKNAYELMNDDPQYFKDVIVGYFLNMNDEIKKMKNFIAKSITKGDLDKYLDNYEQFYIDYYKLIDKHRRAVAKKPKVKFTGEGFKRPEVYKKVSGGAMKKKASSEAKSIVNAMDKILKTSKVVGLGMKFIRPTIGKGQRKKQVRGGRLFDVRGIISRELMEYIEDGYFQEQDNVDINQISETNQVWIRTGENQYLIYVGMGIQGAIELCLRSIQPHIKGGKQVEGGRTWSEMYSDLFGSSEITKYTYESQATLKKYGDMPVKKLMIYKTPLKDKDTMIVNALSLGSYNAVRKKLGEKFDTMFHLALIAVMPDNQQVVVEKNANIHIATTPYNVKPTTKIVHVPINHPFTLVAMTENARKAMGDKKYFGYSALNGNNCQNYVMELLKNVGIRITPKMKEFIFQDITELVAGLPKFVPGFADKITHFWALKDRWLGKGEH